MKITPRADEVNHVLAAVDPAAVEAVLKAAESEESPYASREAFADALITAVAKTVLKAAAEALSMRDTFAVALAYETSEGFQRGHYYGPFGTRGDAEKAADRLAGAGQVRRIVPLASVGQLEGLLDGADWPGFCQCTHAQGDHRMDGNARGPCAQVDCSCKKWKDATTKKKTPTKRAVKGNAS